MKLLTAKHEQEATVNNFPHGRDVMAVSPIGFHKSTIFTVFHCLRLLLKSNFRNIIAELHSSGIVCQKANYKIGVLSWMKNVVHEKMKLHLFNAIILAKLNYCSLVLIFLRASDQWKLEKIQEKGLRAVFKDNTTTYKNLFKNYLP